jgi:hypothetical protein
MNHPSYPSVLPITYTNEPGDLTKIQGNEMLKPPARIKLHLKHQTNSGTDRERLEGYLRGDPNGEASDRRRESGDLGGEEGGRAGDECGVASAGYK